MEATCFSETLVDFQDYTTLYPKRFNSSEERCAVKISVSVFTQLGNDALPVAIQTMNHKIPTGLCQFTSNNGSSNPKGTGMPT
jgi:hypothetical protein